jgi:hypothetical protein
MEWVAAMAETAKKPKRKEVGEPLLQTPTPSLQNYPQLFFIVPCVAHFKLQFRRMFSDRRMGGVPDESSR